MIVKAHRAPGDRMSKLNTLAFRVGITLYKSLKHIYYDVKPVREGITILLVKR